MTNPLPPKIQTYHCLCSTLLLATTHTLSTLPHRSTTNSPSSSPDLILPLPSTPPLLSPLDSELPSEGYTTLLSMTQDKKVTIVRREDGFEKRICWRCERCNLIVGYELQGQGERGGAAMEGVEGLDGEGKGKGREEGYGGKVLFLLAGGVQSTDFMMVRREGGKKIGEQDVDIKGAVAVFE
ncbi:hypothetical protein NA56DRAFT_186268 [Hyaloscypha hepaticicola]|uniref:STEEP1 domain-containing protein n=1 Tax=Hyaloscypha hepaticicola TaxID=2082293 RepID=A0A2J6Q1K1_9HELO|nr:hypothetical protein NA56DRAFT_186268 [Hyaloscypha hepaticicola]